MQSNPEIEWIEDRAGKIICAVIGLRVLSCGLQESESDFKKRALEFKNKAPTQDTTNNPSINGM